MPWPELDSIGRLWQSGLESPVVNREDRMRSSARTPPHRQVSLPQRSPVSPRSSTEEDWSPRRCYKTMRYLFRPDRENPDSLVEIPFYLNCLLSRDQFQACVGHYIEAKVTPYLTQLFSSQHGRPSQRPDPARWPDLRALGVPPASFWKFEIPLGQLFFAETAPERTQARERIKPLTTRGLNARRHALAEARSSTPQAKRKLSGRQRFDLLVYHARRQFLWIFLRAESDWDKGQLKEIKESDDAVQKLALNYSYLGELKGFDDFTSATITDRIAKGLKCSDQADKDAALKFVVKTSSIPSLLKPFPPR